MELSKFEKSIADSLKDRSQDKEFINLLVASVDMEGLRDGYNQAIKQGCPTDIALSATAEAAAAMVYRTEAQANIPQAEFNLFRAFAKEISN